MKRNGDIQTTLLSDSPLETSPNTSATTPQQPAPNAAEPRPAIDPQLLSGLPLAHALLQSNPERELFGSPTTIFAIFNKSKNRLLIVGGKKSNVSFGTVESDIIPAALSEVQKLGGKFIAYQGEVLCEVDGVSASGTSYGEAAMRALLLLNQIDP